MKYLIFLFCLTGFISKTKSQNVFGFEYYIDNEENLRIKNILKNSPAEKVGLKVGDYLNFINDIPLSSAPLERISKLFQEIPNNNNELRYYREGEVYKTIISKVPLSSFEFVCISGNCSNGDCVLESTYGYTIKGKCNNNVISGSAECYNADGSLFYKGNMLNNKFEGNGIQYGSNKSTFEGIFKNGIRQGNGKITNSDNSYLTGFWKDGKIEGNAQFYNANTKQLENRVYKNGKLENETNTNCLDRHTK